MSKATESPDVTDTTLSELPPSAKLVLKVLENHETLTQQGLVQETYMPRRTVRHALQRLMRVGFVDDAVHSRDARKRLYSLSDEYVTNVQHGELAYDS